MPISLKDKVAVITGASQGIGMETALAFAGKGCRVALAARSQKLIETIAGQINVSGGRAMAVATDVSDKEQIRNLCDTVLAAWGRIDIWVNNAGFGIDYDGIFAPEEWVEQIFSVNLMGVYWGTRIAAHAMLSNVSSPRGIIVNISSIASEAPILPHLALYKATKAGVDILSEGLAAELESSKVRIINIKPGLTRTNFRRNMMRKAPFTKQQPGIPAKKVAKKIVQMTIKGRNKRRVIVTLRDHILLSFAK